MLFGKGQTPLLQQCADITIITHSIKYSLGLALLALKGRVNRWSKIGTVGRIVSDSKKVGSSDPSHEVESSRSQRVESSWGRVTWNPLSGSLVYTDQLIAANSCACRNTLLILICGIKNNKRL